MKLFTMGDSISQGFQPLAGARTEQSYSTLIAQVLKAAPCDYPQWPLGGIPIDLERLLRQLEARYGSNIRAFEWPTGAGRRRGVGFWSTVGAQHHALWGGPCASASPAQSKRGVRSFCVERGELADIVEEWSLLAPKSGRDVLHELVEQCAFESGLVQIKDRVKRS